MQTLKCVVQIRGASGSGKSTYIRWLIEKLHLSYNQIVISGKKIQLYTSEDYRTIVLGDYSGAHNTAGMDCFSGNKTDVINIILSVIKRYHPELLYFEKMILGVTFTFGYQLATYLACIGYKYLAVLFLREYDTCFSAILCRNDGKNINEDNLYSNYVNAIKSFNKLKDAGVRSLCIFPDTTKNDNINELILKNGQ